MVKVISSEGAWHDIAKKAGALIVIGAVVSSSYRLNS
jgi:hypothetical protein